MFHSDFTFIFHLERFSNNVFFGRPQTVPHTFMNKARTFQYFLVNCFFIKFVPTLETLLHEKSSQNLAKKHSPHHPLESWKIISMGYLVSCDDAVHLVCLRVHEWSRDQSTLSGLKKTIVQRHLAVIYLSLRYMFYRFWVK